MEQNQEESWGYTLTTKPVFFSSLYEIYIYTIYQRHHINYKITIAIHSFSFQRFPFLSRGIRGQIWWVSLNLIAVSLYYPTLLGE